MVLSLCSPVVEEGVSDCTGLDRPDSLWHLGQWDTQCLFSFCSKGGVTADCLDFAFVNKTRFPRFSPLVLSHHVHVFGRCDWLEGHESKGDIRARLSSHRVDLGHSCAGL